ncbi:MAG TPA: hypothetical protein VKV26_17990 [Dehalococcoidia bacterium]|nr:hypothetical protein [Dehalococcoidia bacterium]
MLVTYWERCDNADRDTFARAALNLCRAQRTQHGIRNSRFYWFGIDTLVVQTDAESLDVFNSPPPPEASTAVFALSDQAHQIRMERWQDAAVGEQSYRNAQAAARR